MVFWTRQSSCFPASGSTCEQVTMTALQEEPVRHRSAKGKTRMYGVRRCWNSYTTFPKVQRRLLQVVSWSWENGWIGRVFIFACSASPTLSPYLHHYDILGETIALIVLPFLCELLLNPQSTLGSFHFSLVSSTKLCGIFFTDSQMFISLPFRDRYFWLEMPLIDWIMFHFLKKTIPSAQ